MCYYCAVEYVTGIDTSKEDVPEHIDWPPITDEMRKAALLIRDLYELPEGGTGGPLHVVVDDYNVEDDSIDFYGRCVRGENTDCDDASYYGEAWPALQDVSQQIIGLFRQMTVAERATTLCVAHRELSIEEGVLR